MNQACTNQDVVSSGLTLLIETHSPWESNDSRDFLEIARALLEAGQTVHLHLIQNAVLWLQQEPRAINDLQTQFAHLLQVSVDDLSLDLRGLPRASVAALYAVEKIDCLVATMARPDVKTIWHS